jgi:hypothetical protein
MKMTTLAILAALLLVASGSAAATESASALGADGLPTSPEGTAAAVALPVIGPDQSQSPLAAFSYYTVLGVQLQPRVSSTTFGYDFNGCLHIAGGTDNRLTFPLLLPDGSVVKYLRIYYNDTSAAQDLTAWLTTYDPGVTSTDLTSVNSTGSSGYGTQLSPEITETFDSAINYTLTVATNTTDATAQICGVRIAFYAPLIFRDGFETNDTSRWSATVP